MAIGKVMFTFRKPYSMELEFPATTEDEFLDQVNEEEPD